MNLPEGKNYLCRSSFINRRPGMSYNLSDLMDMLWVDANLREFIDLYDEVALESYLQELSDGSFYAVNSVYGAPMLVFRKVNGLFVLESMYPLERAINFRSICSDRDSKGEILGRGFAGLGGNSGQAPRFGI